MPDMIEMNFICPSTSAPEEYRLQFLKNAIAEGQSFLQNQVSYPDIQRAKDVIAGINTNKVSEQLSKINVNMEKRLIRDIVATMSNLRPLWGYSNDNPDLDHATEMLNKLLLSWYQTTFADRKIKEWCQWAALGIGYIGPSWESDYWSRGRGDITLKVYGPEDVIPTQLPKDGNLQRAYMVTLKEEVPINLARAMFPTMAQKIQPDRQAPAGIKKTQAKLMSYLSPVLNRFGAGQRNKQALNSVFPVVDIYQTYVLDLSINEGQNPVVMGEPGTYWNYTVPPLNSDIPNGNAPDGTPVYRKANANDAALYPFRRLITWCNGGILRDDTSFWWHGMVPVVPLRFDNWAWEFFGFSMTRDLNSIGESNNTLRRAMDDSANARLRPPTMYDDRTLARNTVQAFDLRVPGQSIPVDMTVSEQPLKPVLPAEFYNVPPFVIDMIQRNEETMKYLSGVNDFTAISKARQLPAGDTIEKIMEMAGPLVTDISRNMEASLGQLGEMMKGMFFQFYTAPRRLQILGKDGLTLQDFEEDKDGVKKPVIFDPKTFVPTHAYGEDPMNGPSRYSMIERAKMYMNSFYFKITPNSLHNITQMTRKLLYVQLQKAGLPIDPWTMAEVMDIPNFGHPPEGTKTVFERWVAWERIKGDLAAKVQATSQQILATAQLQSQMQMMALQAGNISALQPPPSPEGPPPQGGGLPQPSYSPALGNNPPGRPAEFSGSPRIVQKDGGTRSTITGG